MTITEPYELANGATIARVGKVTSMNLAAGDNAQKFRDMLDKTQSCSTYALSDWESQFCADMLAKFEERESQIDMGMTPWNPSIRQWNTLHGIASRL